MALACSGIGPRVNTVSRTLENRLRQTYSIPVTMDSPHAQSSRESDPMPIAIIGLAFEFPQEATTVDSFWQMLSSGRSASTEFPPDRLNINAFYHPDQDRPSTLPLRGGHFVQTDLAAFDAPFFSITPGEAECMDPQHRRMLETAYHALENGESIHYPSARA